MAEKPDKPVGSIEKTVDNLEQMFEKADNEINYLTRKLTFELEYGQDGKRQTNPVRLLDKVQEIKKDYSALTQDLQEIQRTQTETVDYFRNQLLAMTEMLQRLETQTGSSPELSETDVHQLEQLAQVIGLPAGGLVSTTLPPSSASLDPVMTSAAGDPEEPTTTLEPSVRQKEEDTSPPVSAADRRADTAEFIPLNEAEFLSVSELIRVRAKLDDVNRTYRLLWQHFKDERNTEALSPKEMNAKGMKVTGATGEAKLKILRALKLCQINKTGSVLLS